MNRFCSLLAVLFLSFLSSPNHAEAGVGEIYQKLLKRVQTMAEPMSTRLQGTDYQDIRSAFFSIDNHFEMNIGEIVNWTKTSRFNSDRKYVETIVQISVLPKAGSGINPFHTHNYFNKCVKNALSKSSTFFKEAVVHFERIDGTVFVHADKVTFRELSSFTAQLITQLKNIR